MHSVEPRTRNRVGTDPLPRRVAIVAAIAVALAAVILAAQVFGSEDGGSSYLLEPGPRNASGLNGRAVMGYVSPEDLVRNSKIVFIGTVVGEGGAELIGDPIADAAGQGPTVHPVHFAVERTLRGEPAPALDLLYPFFAGDTWDIFETGDRLLVFARDVSFGTNRITGITPRGYHQGVFRMESDDVAWNETTGVRMSVPALADALGR